jgi:hypothetical protein
MGHYYLYFLPRQIMTLLAVVGVILIIAGILYRNSWFQFKGLGLLSQKEEKEIWKLQETEKREVRDFIRVVREELIKGER